MFLMFWCNIVVIYCWKNNDMGILFKLINSSNTLLLSFYYIYKSAFESISVAFFFGFLSCSKYTVTYIKTYKLIKLVFGFLNNNIDFDPIGSFSVILHSFFS